jgi:orotate phosphoribosyltransferase
LIVGHEVARNLGLPHIFAEKEENKLVLRRGFEIRPGDRFLVVEDVVTRGGRVLETLEIVRAHGGVPVGVAAIVDRSGGNLPDFGCPFISLVQLNVETFEADKMPPDLVGSKAVKPGSK